MIPPRRRSSLLPAQITLVVLAALLLAFGCSSPPAGSQRASCPTPPDPQLASVALAALPPQLPAGDASRAAPLYAQQCQRCHASDPQERSSRMFRAYPRLDCESWLESVSDRYLHAAISAGGEAIGKKSVMAAFGETLSAQEIADLVAYLRARSGRDGSAQHPSGASTAPR